jgi:hypothetical protein
VHRTIFLLRCGNRSIIAAETKTKTHRGRCFVSEIWDTKDGRRRVRRDPPTIEEAVLAAQGLTDETGEQIEIVASLMEISADEARGAVLRMSQRRDVVDRITIVGRATRAGQSAGPRAVVVERRTVRRPLQSPAKRFA